VNKLWIAIKERETKALELFAAKIFKMDGANLPLHAMILPN